MTIETMFDISKRTFTLTEHKPSRVIKKILTKYNLPKNAYIDIWSNKEIKVSYVIRNNADDVLAFALVSSMEFDPEKIHKDPYCFDYIYTLKHHRRNGYARILIEHVKTRHNLTATCNSDISEELFRSCDFSEIESNVFGMKVTIFRYPHLGLYNTTSCIQFPVLDKYQTNTNIKNLTDLCTVYINTWKPIVDYYNTYSIAFDDIEKYAFIKLDERLTKTNETLLLSMDHFFGMKAYHTQLARFMLTHNDLAPLWKKYIESSLMFRGKLSHYLLANQLLDNKYACLYDTLDQAIFRTPEEQEKWHNMTINKQYKLALSLTLHD